MDEATLTTTYNSLLNAMQAHHQAAEAAIAARAQLELTRIGAMRDGLIVGKNEDERKIKAYEVMPDAYRTLAEAELAERQAKHQLDTAQLFVELARAQLRLAEINARAGAEA